MTSSPAILPISNQQTVFSGETVTPVSTPAFRAFINNTTKTVRSGLSSRRPWSELVDRSAFSKSDSITDAACRMRKNYSYFRVNYITVIAAAYFLSTSTLLYDSLSMCCRSEDSEINRLSCGHVFHNSCLEKWLNYRNITCPFCRNHMMMPKEEEHTCPL